ncbi:alpha/beta hydrolase [Bacillus infantis]|uniref:alpha/beta fold hydrolase n=1 Tax=Bacillus infantis TaxID=324767 RepID=UPI001CD2A1CC|nr:alpha/beta hydrolase [Bacillus infantis]MCA1041567.1 alpha/beta hydrolase [Bacillus infantis]
MTIYKNEHGKRTLEKDYEEYIETLGFDVERMYVNTSYGRTHVLAAGPKDAKPVFIFQGGNCINPMTLSWFSSLAERYRIYAPDTIGHPGFSEEARVSAQDASFPEWAKQLMAHFQIRSCAFIGPSYGGGIIMRMAAYMPDLIDCAVLVSPAGISLGSKTRMIKDILLPMVAYKAFSSEKHLDKLTGIMSGGSMKVRDKEIIGNVFKYVKLEQDMPKITERHELAGYQAPTLVIAGKQDVFFPEQKLNRAAKEIIPNLTDFKAYEMGHFPSDEYLIKINEDITAFLNAHY